MLIYLQMIESPEDKLKFEIIYQKYKQRMFAVAYDILRNPEDAEDAVHYAFLKVVENIKKIEEADCLKTKGYVVTIVENRAIDIYRFKKAHPTVPFNEETVGIEIEYNEGNVLAGCLSRLSPRQRSIIVLKYHHGYELKEIAKMLGITYTNALAIDQRAKKKLEALCKEAEIL